MATKAENIADPQSCLNRAEDSEPVFVLRAHDPLASDAVRRWAHARALTRGFDAMVKSALDIADAMDEWHAKEKRRG
jgi:hypothetical protein